MGDRALPAAAAPPAPERGLRERPGAGRPLLVAALAAACLPALLAAPLFYALGWQPGAEPAGPVLAFLAVAAIAAACARVHRQHLAAALRAIADRADAVTVRAGGQVPPMAGSEIDALARSVESMSAALAQALERARSELESETQNGIDLQRQFALMRLLRNLASVPLEETALEAALQRSLEEIGDYLDWPIGRLVIVGPAADPGPDRVHWYARDRERFERFERACDEEPATRGDGSRGGLCGRALDSCLSHWATDLTHFEDWGAGAAAKDCGLRTGFVIPVSAPSGHTALVEFYSDHRIEASGEMLELVEGIGAELWQVARRCSGAEERFRKAPPRRRGASLDAADLAPLPAPREACARPDAPRAFALPVVAASVAGTGDPAPSAPGILVDGAVLEQIRAMERKGATGLLLRLLATYERFSGELVDAGADALDRADRHGLARCLHTLRVSSAGLGAVQLAHSCTELASLAAQPSLAAVRSAWPGLRTQREHALATLRSRAAQPAGAEGSPA